MDEYTQVLNATDSAAFVRARVAALSPKAVFVSTANAEPQACDLIDTDSNTHLAVGDIVLAWLPHNPLERGVIVGPLRPGISQPHVESGEDELVFEARKQLTLKCGAGSITIREDGKILIKGKDLVSHAQRLNRIKGGSVQIN